MDIALHFDSVQNYDCIQCGRGCKMGWDIPVEPHVLQGLQGHPLILRVIEKHHRPPFREENGQSFIQSDKECKSCGFLEENNLCGIHRELGFAAKPHTCQVFPFVITETPDGFFVGTTFYCSSVRANTGRPLAAHREDVLQFIRVGGPRNRVADDGLVLYDCYYTNWRDYLDFEKELVLQASRLGYEEALSRAVIGLAGSMAELPPVEGEPVAYPGERLQQLWTHSRQPRGSAARPLGQVVATQIGDFLKFSLPRESWDQIDEAIFSGETFQLPEYGFDASWAALEQMVVQGVGTRFDQEIERYLAHLVFRKALVVNPGLLTSLCQLQMLPTFLKTYAGLIGFSAGHSEANQDDYYAALEIAETYLVTHGRNRRVVNEMAADVLVSTFRPKAAPAPA